MGTSSRKSLAQWDSLKRLYGVKNIFEIVCREQKTNTFCADNDYDAVSISSAPSMIALQERLKSRGTERK